LPEVYPGKILAGLVFFFKYTGKMEKSRNASWELVEHWRKKKHFQ